MRSILILLVAVNCLSLVACTSSNRHQSGLFDTSVANTVHDRFPADISNSEKSADDLCFIGYTHGAGKCNLSYGEDDGAFVKCLVPVKSTLKKCCQRSGGSKNCASDALPVAVISQKSVDDKCFANYSHSAANCNRSAGFDDSSFNRCLTQLKDDLVKCCAFGGSKFCAENASPSAVQKAADDKCFLRYSHGAGNCNTSSGNDDSVFSSCLEPVKHDLRRCCREEGGSTTCDVSAQ